MTAAGSSWLELDDVAFEPGSFRDPSGRVLERSGRILRVLAPRTADDFAWVWDRGIVDALTASGQLVATTEIDPALVGLDRPHVHRVLEHARIDFLSYPYEWCFSGLQSAALLQIDLHLDLLARGATLIDASAYNIQFQGTRPIFIDVLSLRRYREGEIWSAHLQFCQQFLNPLLLHAARGVAFNRWYRGAMEGIPVADLYLSWVAAMKITPPRVTMEPPILGVPSRKGRPSAKPHGPLLAALPNGFCQMALPVRRSTAAR
jgi:hypothetical protein